MNKIKKIKYIHQTTKDLIKLREKYGELYFIHAAAAEKNKKAIVMSGMDGVGKTPLLINLVRRMGFNYMCGDIAPVDKKGYVYPYNKEELREETHTKLHIPEKIAKVLAMIPGSLIISRFISKRIKAKKVRRKRKVQVLIIMKKSRDKKLKRIDVKTAEKLIIQSHNEITGVANKKKSHILRKFLRNVPYVYMVCGRTPKQFFDLTQKTIKAICDESKI